MARKLDDAAAPQKAARQRDRSKAPTARAAKQAEELKELNPQISLPLGGEMITVKEYDFWTAMDVIWGDSTFLDAAIELLLHDERDPWEAVRSLFGRHRQYLKHAASVAAGRDVAWVESLGPSDTDTLMSAWWAVNGHFFLHEAVVVIRGRTQKAKALAGLNSSSPSPTPGSATSTASESTPTGS